MQRLLEYDEWRNFCNVIEKAKTACTNSGQKVLNHFVDINKNKKLNGKIQGSCNQLEKLCTFQKYFQKNISVNL
jgi:hypothetical protein